MGKKTIKLVLSFTQGLLDCHVICETHKDEKVVGSPEKASSFLSPC